MLQRMHHAIKGWGAAFIFIFTAIPLLFTGVFDQLRSIFSRSAKLTVNTHKITQQALHRSYQNAEYFFLVKHRRLPSSAEAQALQTSTLNALIRKYILLDDAKKFGFVVKPVQALQAVTQWPEFQHNGRFSMNRYRAALKNKGISESDLATQLAEQLIILQVAEGIIRSDFILPSELNFIYAVSHQTRDFRYVVLPYQSFKKKVVVTQKMLADYYHTHLQDFKSPEQVQIAYLHLFSMQEADFLKKREQLEELVYTNPNELTVASHALKIPIQYSNFFTRQGTKTGITADPNLIAAAFNPDVVESRNNSGIIQLADGSVLVLRINQHRHAHQKPLAEVSDLVRRQLSKQMMQTFAYNTAEKVKSSLVHSDLHLTPWPVDWKKEKKITPGAANIPKPILKAVFPLNSKVPEVQLVKLDNGDVAVIQVTQIHLGDFQKLTKKERHQFKQQLMRRHGELMYTLYAKSATGRARIKKM